MPENKAERKKLPRPFEHKTHTHTHTRSQGSHQLIQSSVSHCYTHGQQKATRILINNVIHPGLRALNPGILAACFFSLSLSLPRDPRKDAESIFLHSRTHATGLDAYGSELTLEHFVALQMFTFRCNTSLFFQAVKKNQKKTRFLKDFYDQKRKIKEEDKQRS